MSTDSNAARPAAQSGARLDVSATAAVPLGRLVKVELRKMVDTRAGLWLIIGVAAVTALVMGLFLFLAPEGERTLRGFLGVVATPQGLLLPVLGILLVTQEWGQRTGMVTFTLEPNRGKVIWAKVVAACVLGLLAVGLAFLLAALAALLGGAPDAFGGVGVDDTGKFVLLQLTGILQGLAFGLILLNSAAAIVAYFVLPIAFSILVSLWTAMADVAPWVDLGTAQVPLFEGGDLTGEQWARVVTTFALWVVLPFVLGLWRVSRAEVK